MGKENPFENWTYVSLGSGGHNSKEKIFEAIGFCKERGSELVMEYIFNYDKKEIEDGEELEEGLLVIEEKRGDITSLLIPGRVEGGKIYPVSSLEREYIHEFLNGINLEGGKEKMNQIFWNTEVGVKRTKLSSGAPAMR